MNDIVIRAENLSYVDPFQKLRALDDVSFELRRGEAMLVTGASGCRRSNRSDWATSPLESRPPVFPAARHSD